MKNMSVGNNPMDRFSLIFATFVAMFLFLQAVEMAVNVPLGNPPDEYAHLSYINDVSSSERFVPDYTNGKILNSQQPNYMGHPPLYYSALGTVVKILSLEPVKNYKALRVLSAFFVALGFFYFMLAARHLGVDFLVLTLFTLACSAIPMFGYLAGSINNDTLMYLGVGSFFYGVARSRLEPGNIDFISAFHLAIGLIITLLTKATGATFLIFFITVFGLICWKNMWKLMQDKVFLIVVFLVLGICGVYYIYAFWTYGSFFPAPGQLYKQIPPAVPLGMYSYTKKFVTVMLDRLPIIMSHSSIDVFSASGKKIFYLMLLLPLLGWLLARPQATKRGVKKFNVSFSDAFILALIGSGLIHYYVAYTGYLNCGLLAGWQPRYYYYALPFIWIPFFVIAPPFICRWVVTIGFAVCAMMGFWLSVPFVLTKQAQVSAAKFESVVNAPSLVSLDKVILLKFSSRKGSIGAVDELVISENNLTVRGWAFASAPSTRVRRVWFFSNGRYLGSVTLSIARPDVVKAISNSEAINSGYKLQINGVSNELRECEVQVAAELSDGSLDVIRNNTCAD